MSQHLRYAFESSIANYLEIPVYDVCLSLDNEDTRGRYAAKELAHAYGIEEDACHNMYVRRK